MPLAHRIGEKGKKLNVDTDPHRYLCERPAPALEYGSLTRLSSFVSPPNLPSDPGTFPEQVTITNSLKLFLL